MRVCSRCFQAALLSLCLALPLPAPASAETILPPSINKQIILDIEYPGQNAFRLPVNNGITYGDTPLRGQVSEDWHFINEGDIFTDASLNNSASGIFLSGKNVSASRVENSGSIISLGTTGSAASGVRFSKGGTVINLAGGYIEGFDGVHADGGALTVENHGSISGNKAGGSGIYSGQGLYIRNFAGATIEGDGWGISGNGPNRDGVIINDGLIQSTNEAIHLYNGNNFAVANGPKGIITSGGGKTIEFSGNGTGYILNEGQITAQNTAILSSSAAARFVNSGVITAGNNGDGLDLAGSNSFVHNLGVISSAGTGKAIIITGNNNQLHLGQSTFLSILNRTVTGPGSVLNGDVVSNGAGNSILLTESGSEDSLLTGFASLTMRGADWLLSAPLTLTGNTLLVESGTLTLAGAFSDAGGVSVLNGAKLVFKSTATAASLLVDASQLTSAGPLTIAGPITAQNGATLSLGGAINAGSLLADASRVEGFGAIVSGGPITVRNSALFTTHGDIIAPSISVQNKSILNALGTGTFFNSAINIGSGSAFNLGDTATRFTVDNTASLSLSPGSFFGVAVGNAPNQHSILFVNSFTPPNGVLLGINGLHGGDLKPPAGVSSLAPTAGLTYAGVVQTANPVLIPAGMRGLSSPLLSAGLVANGNNADLNLTVRNINDVFGPNFSAVDIWRQTGLPNAPARAWLDNVYLTGKLNADSRRLLALLQGGTILSTQEALRSNLRAFTGAVNSRLAGNAELRSAQCAGEALQERPEGVDDPCAELRFSPWVEVSQRWNRYSGNQNIQGYDYDPTSLRLGFERGSGPWTIGAAGQFDIGEVESEDGGDASVDTKDVLLDVYAAYQADNWYGRAGAQAGVAWNSEKTRYPEWKGSSSGFFHSYLFGINGELGYSFSFGEAQAPFRVTPYAGVEYALVRQDSFSEDGEGGFKRHFDGNTYQTLETPVGVRFSKVFHVGEAMLMPALDVSYAHNFGDAAAVSVASFTGDVDGASWNARGPRVGRDALRLEASISTQVTKALSVQLRYDLEQREDYTGNAVLLQLGWEF